MSSKRLLSGLARRRLDGVRRYHAETIEEDRELIRKGGLLEFLKRAWHEIEPGNFREAWYHAYVCEHLEAVTRGDIKRLIINMPPGCTKTTMASVAWNAWAWTEHPDLRWIYATYSSGLSRRDAVKVRNLIDSEWYRARWPHIAIPRQNTRSATDFANNLGGWRFSTTPGGGATGRHPDIQVVDDPLKPRDAKNKGGAPAAKIEENRVWWKETMASRARDQATLRRVIMMQRVHDLDLAGEMLREGGYEHVCLPMRFESNSRSRTYVTIKGVRELFLEDPRTEEGELLDPDRFPENIVHDLETKEYGPSVAAAQLQQRPTVAGGNMYKTHMFVRRYKTVPPGARWIQSWDVRTKADPTSGSWVVGTIMAQHGADIYIVDVKRGRWGFLETCSAIVNASVEWPLANEKLVENKANGNAVVQVMRKRVQGLVLVEPDGSKTDRAQGTLDLWESNVWLPEGNTAIVLSNREELPPSAPWAPAYIAEHLAFPRGANDDQVDSTTQGLNRLRVTDYSDYAAGVEAMQHVVIG
jgi:predicted phage terminase large subunit-like protein